MSFFDHLRHVATDAARRIAPDIFAAEQVYILDGHAFNLDPGKSTWGVFWPASGIADLIEDDLRQREEWRGPGRAIFIFPTTIARSILRGGRQGSSRRARSSVRATLSSLILGTVLHELAHAALDRSKPVSWAGSDAKELAVLFRQQVSEDSQNPETQRPTLDGHGPEFVRLALHLATRAAAYGVTDRDVFDAERYGLSPTSAYSATLAREPEKMARWPVSRILSTPAPPEFTTLWTADTATK